MKEWVRNLFGVNGNELRGKSRIPEMLGRINEAEDMKK